MSSVGGGTLLEKGLRLCLGTVRLQELNKSVERRRKARQTDFLPMPTVFSGAGLGITGSQTQIPPNPV